MSEIPKIEEGEKKVEQREKRSAEQLKGLISFMVEVLSGLSGIRVIPGGNFSAGLSAEFQKERKRFPNKSLDEFPAELFKPKIFTYPEKELLERDEDYLWGVIRHEIGHFRHTDYRGFMKFQEQATKEGYKASDLYFLFNSWEDGRSNACEARDSEVAAYRLGAYLREDIKINLAPDLSSKPAPCQFGMLCWAKGLVPFVEEFDLEKAKELIKDPEALLAYEESLPILEEFLKEHNGYKAFTEILYDKAWPIYKRLVKKYLEDKAKELRDKEQKKQKEKQEEAGEKQGGGDEGEEEEQKGEKGAEESQGQDGGLTEEKVSGEDEGGEGGNREDENSDWDKLSDEEKEKYREMAKKILREAEEELSKKLAGKIFDVKEEEDGTYKIDFRAPTEEEAKIAKDEEWLDEEIKKEKEGRRVKSEEAFKKSFEEERKKWKERESGMKFEDYESYEKYRAPIKKYESILVKKIDEIFPPTVEDVWEGGYQSGKRIAKKDLAREIATERGRMFERKDVPEIRELAFSLLIDVSGSMSGVKIRNALSGAILMAEAFQKRGVPFSISAFNGNFYELKKAEEKYNGKAKAKLLTVLNRVNEDAAGYNDDGFAVDSAARALQKQLLKHKANGALIVFSDGQPAPSSEHSGPEWGLKSMVDKWKKKLPIIGIGIGAGMEETIKLYYEKNSVYVPNVNKLPNTFLSVLKKLIVRFGVKPR